MTNSNIALDWPSFIREKHAGLQSISDPSLIEEAFNELEQHIVDYADDTKLKEFKKAASFQKNPFSETATKENILEAKSRVLKLLNSWQQYTVAFRQSLPKEYAIEMIRRLLNNFHLHLDEMYFKKPHASAHITPVALSAIHIGNEYDVQHMLYALVKPIFPDARTEVHDDTGNTGIRYDVTIDQYDLTIEVKCSRSGMSERKLTEEIAADAFHYKKKHVFFFIYDKDKIVKNKDSFITTYSKQEADKTIETVVIQPTRLLY